jgi:hypothetical protein
MSTASFIGVRLSCTESGIATVVDSSIHANYSLQRVPYIGLPSSQVEAIAAMGASVQGSMQLLCS